MLCLHCVFVVDVWSCCIFAVGSVYVVDCLHGVRADHSHVQAVLEAAVISVGVDLLPHVIRQLVPNLHAQDQLIRELFGEGKHEATVATTDVNDGGDFVEGRLPFLFVGDWVLSS